MTKTHALNLAKFSFSYRLLKELIMRLDGVKGGVPREWHSFVAAGIIGYFVFGEDNPVNAQINMYLLSRIMIGIVKLLLKKEVLPKPNFHFYPLYAAFCWAASLWLFEHHTDVLQGSLVKSMTYLHKDIDYWSDFKTFLIKNK
ncbi:unnamed protein product [Cylicocyclus nassatus]|uniref:Peroxisomal membrane protein 4 n=1 Tax=Cylicocyclus nassatus TaxID=53992 RepID=A0AA36MAZ9_CYLNA|nr:unnamed protein product [Cylicocyclus nassatus]